MSKPGDVAEGDQAERVAHHARHRGHVPPRLAPAPLAHHAVERQGLLRQAEQQHHGVNGDLLDEDIGAIADDDALGRGRVEVDGVGADRAAGDHLAALQPVEDGGREAAPPGDDRVGVAGPRQPLLVATGRHDGDGDAQRAQRLVLVRIARVGLLAEWGRHDLERHRSPPLPLVSPRVARVAHVAHRASRPASAGPHGSARAGGCQRRAGR
jgi:hypothetical protein